MRKFNLFQMVKETAAPEDSPRPLIRVLPKKEPEEDIQMPKPKTEIKEETLIQQFTNNDCTVFRVPVTNREISEANSSSYDQLLQETPNVNSDSSTEATSFRNRPQPLPEPIAINAYPESGKVSEYDQLKEHQIRETNSAHVVPGSVSNTRVLLLKSVNQSTRTEAAIGKSYLLSTKKSTPQTANNNLSGIHQKQLRIMLKPLNANETKQYSLSNVPPPKKRKLEHQGKVKLGPKTKATSLHRTLSGASSDFFQTASSNKVIAKGKSLSANSADKSAFKCPRPRFVIKTSDGTAEKTCENRDQIVNQTATDQNLTEPSRNSDAQNEIQTASVQIEKPLSPLRRIIVTRITSQPKKAEGTKIVPRSEDSGSEEILDLRVEQKISAAGEMQGAIRNDLPVSSSERHDTATSSVSKATSQKEQFGLVISRLLGAKTRSERNRTLLRFNELMAKKVENAFKTTSSGSDLLNGADVSPAVKIVKKRGRPAKKQLSTAEKPVKKKRGRPRKQPLVANMQLSRTVEAPVKKVGRSRKQPFPAKIRRLSTVEEATTPKNEKTCVGPGSGERPMLISLEGLAQAQMLLFVEQFKRKYSDKGGITEKLSRCFYAAAEEPAVVANMSGEVYQTFSVIADFLIGATDLREEPTSLAGFVGRIYGKDCQKGV